MTVKELQLLCRAYKRDKGVREQIDSLDPKMKLDEFEFRTEPIEPVESGRMPHYFFVMENELERINRIVMESNARIKYLAALLAEKDKEKRRYNGEILGIDWN